ncbi:MAG: hypothetical protein M3N82_13135 [Pseudomonadota bacterium]|nr:hypothetical protein [Pseudomonadota bacterium]
MSTAPAILARGAATRAAHDRFRAVLALAEARLAKGDLAAAAGLAQLAATYAFPANVGLFGSPRLERLLLAIGQRLPAGAAPTPTPTLPADARRHVVHVLTYAKPIGGDSRFAWRWMQLDAASRHSAVITTQAEVADDYAVPAALIEAAHASGGEVRVLESPPARLIEQALELRSLCRSADVVALHLYPYDIVPILALAAGSETAKVVLVHHSDHTFWTGSGVAHNIAHLRGQSDHFLSRRRGLDPRRATFLPIPISDPPRTIDRRDAKVALGLDPDSVLLLTIASPFKYSAPRQIGLLDLVTPVIGAHRNARLLAVGPSDDGAWRAAGVATEGRIQALGRRWDNDLLYAAADVYLDSVPFASITSLLEAGRHGTPLLGFRSSDPDMHLLGAGAPGLDEVMPLPTDPVSYREHLARLIVDVPFRIGCGAQVQQRIRDAHTGEGWLRMLAGVYADLDAAQERGCLGEHGDALDESGLDLALEQLFGPMQGRARNRRLVGHCIAPLPYPARLSITLRLWMHGFGLNGLNLLPPPFHGAIRGLGRRVKAIRRASLAPRKVSA